MELRLSAARTRSDWSKTFPARFFENGRVEEEEGRGEGGATATESWPIWATTEYAAACLRHIHSKFYFYLQPSFPGSATKNILCVGFNVGFFVPRLFLLLESTHSTLFMDLFPKSKSRNDEAGKYILFREVGEIKYSSNMQIRFLRSLFVHESWVNGKIVQELHSQSFHPRFLGSKRAPAWALTFLWLALLQPHLSFATEIIKRTTRKQPTPAEGKERVKKGPNLRCHY